MASVIAPLGTLISGFLNRISDKEDKNSQHATETLQAIRDAAGETLKYERWRKKNEEKRDDEREMDISVKWYQVSYRVAHYKEGEELAKRLAFKGAYWQAPEKWTDLEILSAGIGLEQIVEETDRLLKYRIKKV